MLRQRDVIGKGAGKGHFELLAQRLAGHLDTRCRHDALVRPVQQVLPMRCINAVSCTVPERYVRPLSVEQADNFQVILNGEAGVFRQQRVVHNSAELDAGVGEDRVAAVFQGHIGAHVALAARAIGTGPEAVDGDAEDVHLTRSQHDVVFE